MKQVFNEKIEQLDGNERNFELEFELYLLAAILGSDDFNSYSELKLFIEKQNWLDINILAMLDTHLKRLKNIEKLRFRNDDDLKYLSKKVEQKKKRLGNIADTVNKPIKKLLEEKPAGNNAYDK